MSSKNWIEFPRVEGETSRQAHADLPAGTYEREIGREGFFGPAAHIYHKHPPTGWTTFEGPLRPRAFDAVKAVERRRPSRIAARCCSRNAHLPDRASGAATQADAASGAQRRRRRAAVRP